MSQNVDRVGTMVTNGNSVNLDRNLSASPSSSFCDSSCTSTSFHLDRVKREVQEADGEHIELYVDDEGKLDFSDDTLKESITMSTNDTLLAAVSAASTSASCMFYNFIR